MSQFENPTIYVSPGFQELARQAGVVGIISDGAGVDTVLRCASERYATGQLPTAVGWIALFSPGEELDARDTVHQAITEILSEPLPARRPMSNQGVEAGQVQASGAHGLIVPNVTPDETQIAWGIYDAGRRAGRPTENLADFATRFAAEALPNDQSLLGLLGQISNPILQGLASSMATQKRQADKTQVENARPVRLLYDAASRQ